MQSDFVTLCVAVHLVVLRLGSGQALCNDAFEDNRLLGRGLRLISCVVLKLTHEDESRDVNVLEFSVSMTLAYDQKEREQAILALEELRLEVLARLG